ncbi:hypothetical protein [Flavobacterium sp. N3904]|uniref:hypothetical protein n=1 Tax=Flavobacterium sp. N3904 TaxID=2986835 RepID=UPI00222455A9|nr:hypothetical protein [Flavobacterium sp. N3904]
MKTFKLDSEPKIETGFKTPENYFENFSAQFSENFPKQEVKVISIFRKRRTILMAIAAVLVLALMIPIVYTAESKSKELDSATLENYLAEESNINQYELIGEIEPETKISNTSKNEPEAETLEDILATNPNIENLVIEN